MISVVIPYFQRQPGILARALGSIARQENCPLPVHVIVVDDESPVPAADEVRGMPLAGFTLEIVRQANAGPGAARNTGLDHVAPATRYLAFLDSDDEWSPDHLARAVKALDAGFNFYFADLFQIGQTVGAFARAGRIDPARHPAICLPVPGLHAYQGDLFDQVLRGNVIGTPAVVYHWQTFASQRFRVEYASAGEDYLFWMTLAVNGAKAAFSSQVEVTCGKGVNIYAGSGWGTEGHLRRVHEEIRYRCAVRKHFTLSGEQIRHLDEQVGLLRIAFARDILHRIRHRKGFPKGLLSAHASVDPWTLATLPMAFARILLKRA